jgi:hypothetical protein
MSLAAQTLFNFDRKPWEPQEPYHGKLTDDENILLQILKNHEGAANAIEVDSLISLPFTEGHTERYVRRLLKSLTEKCGIAIATSIKPPYGAFLITDAAELEAYTNVLLATAKSQLRRVAMLRKIHALELLGQLAIEFKN